MNNEINRVNENNDSVINTNNSNNEENMLKETEKQDTKENKGTDILSNDNVSVGIRPDVKDNIVRIQICSCSVVFSCFEKYKEDN
jgi:hypothetical protein